MGPIEMKAKGRKNTTCSGYVVDYVPYSYVLQPAIHSMSRNTRLSLDEATIMRSLNVMYLENDPKVSNDV